MRGEAYSLAFCRCLVSPVMRRGLAFCRFGIAAKVTSRRGRAPWKFLQIQLVLILQVWFRQILSLSCVGSVLLLAGTP
jgi:hypothetical protein